jgi:hypothetical protein
MEHTRGRKQTTSRIELHDHQAHSDAMDHNNGKLGWHRLCASFLQDGASLAWFPGKVKTQNLIL